MEAARVRRHDRLALWRHEELAPSVSCARSSESRRTGSPSGASCERWATASCRSGRRRIDRIGKQWRRSRKLSHRHHGDPRSARPRAENGGLVPGRGPHRPEEPDHSALGAARYSPPRPRAPHDQRTRRAYMFGAICPKLGKGAGIVIAAKRGTGSRSCVAARHVGCDALKLEEPLWGHADFRGRSFATRSGDDQTRNAANF